MKMIVDMSVVSKIPGLKIYHGSKHISGSEIPGF